MTETTAVNDIDLTDFLRDWPHEPGHVNARRIIGQDGEPKIQVRVELGVIQMEMSGRPDGRRAEGFASLLALQRHRLKQYQSTTGRNEGFALSDEEARELRDEALQYYHRYVALFAIGEYELVIRDTMHILEIDELCRTCAASEPDREALQPFRTSAVTMRARAEAEFALATGQPKEAMNALDRGLAELRAVFQELGPPDAFEQANEVALLRGMRDVLVPKLPASQRVELHQRLQAAIESENYELAAILRDEIRMMKD